ncbi:MAG: radical SAM protein [Selenomonadaceae bacterium]|nr:radical SAM protein [Selenomonadaceae bacterium]
MHFTSGINRPPYEANSGFLQVTSGCFHASCAFCSYFKDTRFKKSPMEEIEADVREIPEYFGAPERIFLQGADGFAADYDVLMKTAELIHRYVPSAKTIGGYARIDNFREKSVEQLKDMKAAGFAEPYIGVESGDDAILKMVNKGYDAAFAREQVEKLTEAGMSFIANFLNGLGGAGYGLSHARKTAEIYEGMDISMIEVSSLTLVPKTILYRRRERGEFAEAGEHERLEEMKEFIRCLKNKTVFLSDHISVLFRARANLPEDKGTLIEGIQKVMDNLPEERMQTHRRMAANYF